MSNPTSTHERDKSDAAQPNGAARVISDREFVLERMFKAPASRVFGAYTDPKLIARWWVPTGGTLRVEDMDVQPGGQWRFIQPLPNGQEIAYSGTYLEVQAPTRLVHTLEVEGQAGSKVTATLELTEVDGTTRLSLTNECASKEAREAMVKYGAATGANMAWNRLAELLARA